HTPFLQSTGAGDIADGTLAQDWARPGIYAGNPRAHARTQHLAPHQRDKQRADHSPLHALCAEIGGANMNIAELLQEQAHSTVPAIIERTHGRDRVTSFAELQQQVTQAAALLWQAGLRP